MHGESKFYGATTVGTKGQIVIPQEARENLGLKPGDKVVIFGKQLPGNQCGMVCISPIASVEHFVEQLTSHVTSAQEALRQAKQQGKEG